ncbi:hypothetical protein ABPG72_019283 [Tetrahymena utriculariae]
MSKNYKKLILVLAFVLIVQKIAATDKSNKNCDYNEPTDKCECTKYLDSKNECVENCAQGEYPFDYQGIDKFSLCATCKSKSLYTSISQKNCVNQCSEDEVKDKEYNICLASEKDCIGHVKDNQCHHCKENQLIDRKNQKCLEDHKECGGFQKDKECIYCKDDEVTNSLQLKCQKKEDPCLGILEGNKCKGCEDKIIFESKCITEKECDKSYIYIIQDNENQTQWKQCNLEKCPIGYYQVSKEGQNEITCQSKCKNSQILDSENQICYDKQNECKKFISSDEKQCVAGCEEGELIDEQYRDNNQYRKCIQTSECKRYISSDKKYCIEKCANNELTYENKCVKICPENSFYSEDKKSCLKECPQGQSIKSNGRQCLNNCNLVYKILVEEGNKCLECKVNEQFTYDKTKGVCKEANSAQQILSNIENLFQIEQNKIAHQDFEQHILNPIQKLISENENKINQVISKSQKDEKDLVTVSETLRQQNQMVFNLLKLIKPEFYDKSIVLGKENLKIIAQAQIKGFQFKTKFISDEVAQNKTATILIEESKESTYPVFNTSAMILTYMKQNYLCKESECKNTHPLHIISYIDTQTQRILADTQVKPQEFEMEYKINSSNKTNQLLCLSYDQKGSITRLPITVKEEKAFCKFNYSTSMLFDENCTYVDKKYCSQKTENPDEKPIEEKTKDEQNTISLAKIFFIIGILGLLVIYCLRKDSKSQKPEQRSKARIHYDDDDQMMEDMEKPRRRYPKQI